MSAPSDVVRVLPFRVRPLPDEPFDSWLEMMASSYQATLSEMARALGLIHQHHGLAVSATTWMANSWATALTDEQTQRLELSTGIPAGQFHEMTRMRFAHHAIRYTKQGRISAACPAGGTAGSYCPECLADSGGRWRMSWQFPFGFACTRHRRLLLDVCPACRRPASRYSHPLALVPMPGHCHNPVDGPGRGPQPNRCRADLTIDGDRIPVSPVVLDAQRTIMRIVSSGRAGFGIYADAPQPAIPVLEDVRLMARVTCTELAETGDVDGSLVGHTLLERFRTGSDWTRATRLRPETAAGAAVGNTLAIAALTDRDRVLQLLRGRIADSTAYTAHTPQLQLLIAEALGRKRRPTMFLQSAPIEGVDPVARARKIPAQLWDDWCARLAPPRIDHDIAAAALSAAVVFTGSRLTHAAAIALLDTHDDNRHVTRVMRELGRRAHDTGALTAILRLATYLDAHNPPIDYARRRTLDCASLLPEDEWRHLCRQLGVSPGTGSRWTLARAHLYRRVTGNATRSVPTHPDAPSITSTAAARFTATLPPDVCESLDDVGREFLTRHGIDEPLSWSPPVDQVTSILDADLPLPPGPWPQLRPAREVARSVSSPVPLPDAYVAGASTYELAAKAGVSRQTISRALAEAGTPTRRGRTPSFRLDADWLAQQYVTQRRTIDQIADLVGCSPMTINRNLHEAGIPVRPRGGSRKRAGLPA